LSEDRLIGVPSRSTVRALAIVAINRAGKAAVFYDVGTRLGVRGATGR
jgi:hypothetical protein